MPNLDAPATPEAAPMSGLTRVAIVVSRYNRRITDRLLEGAIAEHERLTGGAEAPAVIWATGSFELPLLAMQAARSGGFDAIVALGCIIRGETSHDRHIAGAVSEGLMRVGLETGVAIGFGVLTVEDIGQAEARAGGVKGNKGAEALHAALESAQAAAEIRSIPRRSAK